MRDGVSGPDISNVAIIETYLSTKKFLKKKLYEAMEANQVSNSLQSLIYWRRRGFQPCAGIRLVIGCGRLREGNMQSKSHAFSACGILIVLAGCYAVPANTDFQMTLAGNYKNIADCAFLDFRKEGGWIKTDYDTLNKSEFAFGNAETTGGRIDIIGIDAHHTRIDSFFPQAIWGKDYWPKRHRPIFTRCAAK